MTEMSISPISSGMPRSVEYAQPEQVVTQDHVIRFEERLAQSGVTTITIEGTECGHLQGNDKLTCEMRSQLDDLILKNQQYNNPYIDPSSKEVLGQEIRKLQGGLDDLNAQVDDLLRDFADRGNRGQLPAGDYDFGSTGNTTFSTGQTGQPATMWNGGEIVNPYAGLAEPTLGGGDSLREMIRETEQRIRDLQWATRRLDPPPQ